MNPINQILAQLIASDSAKLFPYPESRRVFWPDGRRLRVGDVFRNPELAATLRRIAAHGRRGFEEGPEAAALIRQLNAGGHPATLADLGFPISLLRGFALLARTAGLLGHLAEEMEHPLGMPLYREVDERAKYDPPTGE